MNSQNSETSYPQISLFKVTDKTQLVFAFPNLSIYYTSKNIKSSCKGNKLKVSAPVWIDEFK